MSQTISDFLKIPLVGYFMHLKLLNYNVHKA